MLSSRYLGVLTFRARNGCVIDPLTFVGLDVPWGHRYKLNLKTTRKAADKA
jgi:hypothetical protein